jgi:hypothetical protein
MICSIGDKEVARVAKTRGLIRSEAAFGQAVGDNIGIVAMRLIEEGKFNPYLVIWVAR